MQHKHAKKDGHNWNDIFSSCISLCYDIFSSFLFVILVFLCNINWSVLSHILPYYTRCTISCHNVTNHPAAMSYYFTYHTSYTTCTISCYNVSIYMLYNLFHNVSTIYQCKIILSLSVQHYSYSPSAELVFQRLQTRVQVDTRN